MDTTTYGGKGPKGRAAYGDRPVGAASCRRDHHTMASCQNPPPNHGVMPTPPPPPNYIHPLRGWAHTGRQCGGMGRGGLPT